MSGLDLLFYKTTKSQQIPESREQKLIDLLGIEADSNGALIPFASERIHSNIGGIPKEEHAFTLKQEAGNPQMLSILVGMTQHKDLHSDTFSTFTSQWWKRYEVTPRLRKWSLSCFDEDIRHALIEAADFRFEQYHGRSIPSREIMKGEFSGELMHMHMSAMTKADLIAVRTGEEQGTRWGIDFVVQPYLDRILASADMRTLYDLRPAEWEQ